jgi:hypothetical protein
MDVYGSGEKDLGVGWSSACGVVALRVMVSEHGEKDLGVGWSSACGVVALRVMVSEHGGCVAVGGRSEE